MPSVDRALRKALVFLAAGAQPHTYSLFQTVAPYTMVNPFKLRNIWQLASAAERRGLTGAFVECGVWRGGAAAVMAYAAERAGSGRAIWLFDSFEGLPEPTERDGQKAATYARDRVAGSLIPIGECVATIDDVREVLVKVGVNLKNVTIAKGWFQDTVPASVARIDHIAVLRVDGDWYESTRTCLEGLYDLIVPGGYLVLDDYDFWSGSRSAVDDFFAHRRLPVQLRRIPRGGRYMIKP